MAQLADYTLSQVGPAPKVRIVDTGWAFYGIESSSILEPIVKLYRLTGYLRYLDFAEYIVENEGACKREDIFQAILNGKDPKDVGSNGNPLESIAKAYEMMSYASAGTTWDENSEFCTWLCCGTTGSANGETRLHTGLDLASLWIYNRPLRISEAIANYRSVGAPG